MVPANQRQKKSVPLSRWKPSQYKSKAGSFCFFIVHFWWEKAKVCEKRKKKDKGYTRWLRYETTILCPHSLLLPQCHNVSSSCPRNRFLPLCLCHTSKPQPSFFVDFYWLIHFTIGWWMTLPRMLVMCLSNLLWWQYFLYLKKILWTFRWLNIL